MARGTLPKGTSRKCAVALPPQPPPALPAPAYGCACGRGHCSTAPPATCATRRTFKGYEEVHVPAVKPATPPPGEELVPIEALPEWAQLAFGGYKTLNRIQSRIFTAAFTSNENMLVCAPTGEAAGRRGLYRGAACRCAPVPGGAPWLGRNAARAEFVDACPPGALQAPARPTSPCWPCCARWAGSRPAAAPPAGSPPCERARPCQPALCSRGAAPPHPVPPTGGRKHGPQRRHPAQRLHDCVCGAHEGECGGAILPLRPCLLFPRGLLHLLPHPARPRQCPALPPSAAASGLAPPSPVQALAAEVTANFGKRLQPLGLSVRELTGDMQLSKKEMAETQARAGGRW